MSNKLIEDFNPKTYEVYHSTGGKDVKESIDIYEDDSLQEIYHKIGSKEKVSQEYIHLWYYDKNKNYKLLGFEYEEIDIKELSSLNESEYVSESIDEEGTQIISAKNYTIHKTIENIGIQSNRIYYMTLQDYLKSIQLSTKDINREKWSGSLDYLQFINGKIRVYWPQLNEEMIQDPKNKEIGKKVKRINKIVKNTTDVLNKIFTSTESMKPSTLSMSTLVFDNKIELENIVNIVHLFSDISLSKYKDYTLVFSKIMMDGYEDSHYKVLKSSIRDKNYPKNPLSEADFLRFTKGIVISIPNVKVKYLDLRRTVSFIFYRDGTYIHVNISDKGEIKIIIQSFIIDEIDIGNILHDMNSFIEKKIISPKIYFGVEKKIFRISEELNDPLTSPVYLMNYGLEYDIKDFNSKVLEKMIQNLSVFFRIENISDSKIQLIYKRVNEYNSVASKLQTISKIVQETDKREEIIRRIADTFNILDEDAVENYEIWKQLSQKGYHNSQEGVDLLVEGFKSSHIKVTIGGCSSKSEMNRLNHVLNTLMSCYFEYIEKKKDKLSLMKKKKIEEDLIGFSDEEDVEEKDDSDKEKEEDKDKVEEEDKEEEEDKDKDKEEEEDKEDSESSGSIDMGLLDELDSDEDESFGGSRMVGGGYDLRSYYLNRLAKNSKYDNELFNFTTSKTHQSKKGELKGTYARACSANYSRHPIALTEKELNEIKDNPDYGEGIGYSNAIKIEGRPTTINGDIYYICPKYWDVKNETPLNPLKLDEFRENVFGMDYSKNPSGDPIKTTAKDKSNTEKYVLVRSGYHWTNAGDDIMRYKVEPMENVHPDGFSVPCCNVDRLEKIGKKDKVQWYDEKAKKWLPGVCVKKGSDKDESKPYVIDAKELGERKVPRKYLKKYKENKHISNAIPCNEGKYCHIHEILKRFIGQHSEMPKKGESDRGIYKLGLVRKGVSRDSDSLLSSLQVLLQKKSIEILINHIITDLSRCKNIFRIANGAFVNYFYSDLNNILEKDVKGFVSFLEKQKGVSKRHKSILVKNNYNRENLFKGTPSMGSLNNHYYRVYSSIKNYEAYLHDDTQKEDKYIVSVLCSIMKMKGNVCFGEVLSDTGILVVEEINDEIRLSEPIGGFMKEFDKVYLLYKRRDNYEPIFVSLFDEYLPQINPYSVQDVYEQTIKDNKKINNRFESIHEFLKNIVESLRGLLREGKKKEYKQIVPPNVLIQILEECELPIESVVYDDYGMIRYIETKFKGQNCLVPVKPSSLEGVQGINEKYIQFIKDRPDYASVNNLLKLISKKVKTDIYLNYDSIRVNVIDFYTKETQKGKSVNKHNLYIKEIVVNETSFIPVQKTLYRKSSHPDVLFKGEIFEIDNYISRGEDLEDKAQSFLLMNTYQNEIRDFLSREIYIHYLQSKSLQKNIETIKNSKIKKTYHKTKEIYELLNESLKDSYVFKDEEYENSLEKQKNGKINLYHTDELENTQVYYKLVMNISSLFVNYSKLDYNRLINAYMNEEMLSKSIRVNELYFNQNDIELDEYKYLFENRSISLRNINLVNDLLTKKQYERLKKYKNMNIVSVDFEKKYPKIINEYLHKNSLVLKYDKVSKYSILQMGIPDEDKISDGELKKQVQNIVNENNKKEWILDETEMNVLELFQNYLGNKIQNKNDILTLIKDEKRITVPELYLLSNHLKRGFNLVMYNEDNTIELMILLSPSSLGDSLGETNMISLIQTKIYLGNISIRNELIFPLDSYSKKYYDVLRKQHRRIYDELKT